MTIQPLNNFVVVLHETSLHIIKRDYSLHSIPEA